MSNTMLNKTIDTTIKELIPKIASRKKPAKVMAIGNYNGVNLGDNAILKTILFDLEKLPLKIFIPTRFPQMTKQIYREGLRNEIILVQNKTPYLELIKHSLRSEIIFVGGGTIYSKYAGKFVFFLPYYLILMRLIGKKIIYYSQGFDPSTVWYLRFAAYLSMILASKVSVRDIKSYNTMRLVRVFRSVELIADPVKHILDIKTEKTKELVKQDITQLRKKYFLQKDFLLQGGYVLTCFNDVKDIETKALLTEKLILLVDSLTAQGKKVLMASFQHADIYIRDDYKLNKHIQAHSKNPASIQVIEEMLDPFTTIELMKQAEFVITERLHSMVLADLAEVNFFGISYQRKCTAFLEQINHTNFVEVDSLVQMTEAEIKKLL